MMTHRASRRAVAPIRLERRERKRERQRERAREREREKKKKKKLRKLAFLKFTLFNIGRTSLRVGGERR